MFSLEYPLKPCSWPSACVIFRGETSRSQDTCSLSLIWRKYNNDGSSWIIKQAPGSPEGHLKLLQESHALPSFRKLLKLIAVLIIRFVHGRRNQELQRDLFCWDEERLNIDIDVSSVSYYIIKCTPSPSWVTLWACASSKEMLGLTKEVWISRLQWRSNFCHQTLVKTFQWLKILPLVSII